MSSAVPTIKEVRAEGDAVIHEKLFEQYLQALLDGDRESCQRIVLKLLDSEMAIKTIYTALFQQSLYRVGELWETNKISVATEHVATAITESLLNILYPKIFGAEHCGRKAVISCTSGEWHQVGGKMVADIFELNGWDSHFLGANTSPDDLLLRIDELKPDVVGLSLSLAANTHLLIQTAETVKTNFSQLAVYCGGQAFRWGGVEEVKRLGGIEYIPSLDDLEKIIAP